MRLPRTNGEDVVSWTSNDEVTVNGQRLRGKNIVDLVGDVVRSTPSKTIAPQREQFLSALAEVNVPETLVKNKMALERYCESKTDGDVAMATMRRNEDDDDVINDATVSSTTKTHLDNDNNSTASTANKKNKNQVEKGAMEIDINWNAPR